MDQEIDLEPVGEDRDVEELLEPEQYAALQALLAGASVTEAAEEAGVTRQTVHRWLSEHRIFKGEYDRIRRKAAETLEQQLVEMARAAADTIQETLEEGSDPWLALQYLQSQELLRPDAGSEEESASSPETQAEVRERFKELSPEELRILRRKQEELEIMREVGLGGDVWYLPELGEWVEIYRFRVAPAGEILDQETRENLWAYFTGDIDEEGP